VRPHTGHWPQALAELETLINKAKAAHADRAEGTDYRQLVARADEFRARDLDCLHASEALLRRALSGRRPPRRLRARFTMLPGSHTYEWQLRRLGHLVPKVRSQQEFANAGLVDPDATYRLTSLAQQLHLGRDASFAREMSLMDPAVVVDDRTRELKNLPLAGKRGGIRHRWQLSNATAIQIPDTRTDEQHQLVQDRRLVWERSYLYAEAVLDLLGSART
jgi:hypothetical protein